MAEQKRAIETSDYEMIREGMPYHEWYLNNNGGMFPQQGSEYFSFKQQFYSAFI